MLNHKHDNDNKQLRPKGRGVMANCSKIIDFHCNVIYASQAAGNLPAEIKYMLRIKVDQLESTSQRLMSRYATYILKNNFMNMPYQEYPSLVPPNQRRSLSQLCSHQV